MTAQEAIAILDGFDLRNNTDKYDIEALNMAQEALEKQILKKPKIMPSKLMADEKYWFFCPNCKASRHVKFKYKHCSFCGQALDWSDEE